MIHVYTSANIDETDTRVGGIGIYFGEGHPRNVSQTVEQNGMTVWALKIEAVYRALILSDETQHMTVFTDSQYVIDCLLVWRWPSDTDSGMDPADYEAAHGRLVRECRKIIGERRGTGVVTNIMCAQPRWQNVGIIAARLLAVQAMSATGPHEGHRIIHDINDDYTEYMGRRFEDRSPTAWDRTDADSDEWQDAHVAQVNELISGCNDIYLQADDHNDMT